MRYRPATHGAGKTIGAVGVAVLEKQAVADQVFSDAQAGHHITHRGAVGGIFADVQILDGVAAAEAGICRVGNAQVVATDHIHHLAGFVEAVHLPVGDQAIGQGAGVELDVMGLGKGLGTECLVPHAHVVQGAVEGLVGVHRADVLILAKHQVAAGSDCCAGLVTAGRADVSAIDVHVHGAARILPSGGDVMHLAVQQLREG